MIAQKELRIGNFILIDDASHKICLINSGSNSADASFIGYEHEGKTSNVSCTSTQVKPVPLTDKVLEQCGFTYQVILNFGKKRKALIGKRQKWILIKIITLLILCDAL